MQIIKKLITGLLCVTGLLIYSGEALALYSPRLSQGVSAIRQHIQSSQAQNGGQTILEEIEQIKAYDKAKRDLKDETGISGDAKVAMEYVFKTINAAFILSKGLDSLAMVFNINFVNGEIISTCLRDDIWHLETLRNIVGSEMIKAYMLRDTYHGALLMNDYIYLNTNIDLLRKYGSNPQAQIHATRGAFPITVTSHEYFFNADQTADDQINYYSNVDAFLSYGGETSCPEGEFERAIEEVVNSWQTLKGTIGGHSLFSATKWGSIWAMAEANSRTRAEQWIKANQLELTVGGEQGGNPQSLIKRDGLNRFAGDLKTQIKILENMVGFVTPFFSKKIYQAPLSTATARTGIGADCVFYYHEDNIFRDCNENQMEEYQRCKSDPEEAKQEYGIRCDRYVNRNEILSVSTLLTRQQALLEENQQTREEVKTAFIYSLTFDSVAENSLYDMDRILWDMNSQIRRGYEKVHEEAGLSIPTLTREITALSDRQCVNKQ